MKNEFGNSVSESEHRLRQWIGSIQARSGDLAASEAKVVDLLLTDPLFFGASTTAEVAARAGVSPPTVIRAARALGFSADSTPFGHSAHADPDTCSTIIRTGSRSAATQGLHC
ncbi:MurR/RpiR family transcriptional regulator [Pseudomonas paraeruginosa]|uniref:MurR/RpiR family transcriptional regulator n=1 Tax=Pseudomonas paraeruginosa TaxID=2994495 RepID=UPI003A813D38